MELKKRILVCAEFVEAIKENKHAAFVYGCIAVARNYAKGKATEQEWQDAINYAQAYMKHYPEPIIQISYCCLIGDDPYYVADLAHSVGVSQVTTDAILSKLQKPE